MCKYCFSCCRPRSPSPVQPQQQVIIQQPRLAPVIQETAIDVEETSRRFNYATISKCERGDLLQGSGFISMPLPNSVFIGFAYEAIDPRYPKAKMKYAHNPGGWKLHIAINDRGRNINEPAIPDRVAEAWDAIVGILIEHRVGDAKVIKSSVSLIDDATQSGKQITIQYYISPERDWPTILIQIEKALRAKGIQEGRHSSSDRVILGSRYITYRNEFNKTNNSKPLTADDAGIIARQRRTLAYNPFEMLDPFEHLNFTN